MDGHMKGTTGPLVQFGRVADVPFLRVAVHAATENRIIKPDKQYIH
jgi:hypothetical protein